MKHQVNTKLVTDNTNNQPSKIRTKKLGWDEC